MATISTSGEMLTAPARSLPGGRDERTLMPGSAPPASLRRPAPAAHGRYMGNALEREYATLAGCLDALDQDIRRARRVARDPRAADRPPPATPHGEPAQLADGTPILIRPIEAEDAEQLRAGFQGLDAGSRYQRFLMPIAYLTGRELDFLTRVDHVMHEALVAIDPASGEGVGVARFLRDARDPSRADVAIVVVDRWQGRGVGTLLAARLCARARAVGVTSFSARMLAGNHAARRLVERVGEDIRAREDGGAVLLTATPRTSTEATGRFTPITPGRGNRILALSHRRRSHEPLHRAR
jgi:RimJ/RimL family protein N-acetyltransferase